MYRDTISRAVVGLRNRRRQRHFDGSFDFNGARYEVHPDASDDGIKARGVEEHVVHIITRSKSPDMIDEELYGKLKKAVDKEVEDASTGKRATGTDYYPELAIVVDYSEYIKWPRMFKTEASNSRILVQN